jgi:ATP-dependent Zn protease
VIKISVNRKNRKKIRKITWPHHLYGQQRINDNSKKKKKIYCAKNQTEKEDKKNYFRSKKEKRRCCSSMDVRQKGNDEMTAHDILHLFSSFFDFFSFLKNIIIIIIIIIRGPAGGSRAMMRFGSVTLLLPAMVLRCVCA